MKELEGARIAVALTGSFCTFHKVFAALPELARAGAQLTPILSDTVQATDNRFYGAKEARKIVEEICGREALTTLEQVEPIGPRKLFDLVLAVPCTGNTLAKLAAGIADTPVTMACKSQLRNERGVLLGVSTNDGLGASARNIGQLLSRKHIFFVPFGQDDPAGKPASLVFHEAYIMKASLQALAGRQIQPLLVDMQAGSRH